MKRLLQRLLMKLKALPGKIIKRILARLTGKGIPVGFVTIPLPLLFFVAGFIAGCTVFVN